MFSTQPNIAQERSAQACVSTLPSQASIIALMFGKIPVQISVLPQDHLVGVGIKMLNELSILVFIIIDIAGA